MLITILAVLLIIGFLFSISFFNFLVVRKYRNSKLDNKLLLLIILPVNISYLSIIIFILLVLFM